MPQSNGLWTAVIIIACILVPILPSVGIVSELVSNDIASFTCSTLERSRGSIISVSVVLVN